MCRFEIESGDRVTAKIAGKKLRGTVSEVRQIWKDPPVCDISRNNFDGDPLIRIVEEPIVENVPVADVKLVPSDIPRRVLLSIAKTFA